MCMCTCVCTCVCMCMCTACALQVHSQIAAFLYAAIAEEGISEEEARDELDAICVGLPTSYTWRQAAFLWEPAFLQPRVYFAWAANLLLLLLLELVLVTFILKLGKVLDFSAFLQSFFYYMLIDPIKEASWEHLILTLTLTQSPSPNPNPNPDPDASLEHLIGTGKVLVRVRVS